MLKQISIFKALIFAATCSAFATSNYSGGLKIGRLTVDNSGVMVGFDRRPDDCAGNYYSWHAKLSSSTPGYNQVLALLLAAKSAGETIDIWYGQPSSQLNCNDPGSLLQMYGAGYHN
jgi:hypothetical protein